MKDEVDPKERIQNYFHYFLDIKGPIGARIEKCGDVHFCFQEKKNNIFLKWRKESLRIFSFEM